MSVYFQSVQTPVAISTTTSVVAAVAGAVVTVMGGYFVSTAGGTFGFQSHTTTGVKTGLATLTTGDVVVLPYNPDGWFRTRPGEALDVVCSAAIAGSINYVQF